jgi:hypothetical protein
MTNSYKKPQINTVGLGYFVKPVSDPSLTYTGINPSIECAVIKDTLIDYASDNLDLLEQGLVLRIDIGLQDMPEEVCNACMEAVNILNAKYGTSFYKYSFKNEGNYTYIIKELIRGE